MMKESVAQAPNNSSIQFSVLLIIDFPPKPGVIAMVMTS
jgi:hypothetical protein